MITAVAVAALGVAAVVVLAARLLAWCRDGGR